MIAVISPRGAINMYTPGSIPVFGVRGGVRVSLTRDGDTVGWVTFGLGEEEVNERATEATYLLSGAYVRITGEALFDVADGALLQEVVAEVAV